MRAGTILAIAFCALCLTACEGDTGLTETHTTPEGKVATAHSSAPDFTTLLPAHQLPSEMLTPGKADEAFDFRKNNPQWYAITEGPAAGTFRHLTEWESQQMLLITVSPGISQEPQVAQTLPGFLIPRQMVLDQHRSSRVLRVGCWSVAAEQLHYPA